MEESKDASNKLMSESVESMQKALKNHRSATLTDGVCGIVANNESRHAVMIVLASLTGALLKKGEVELAEKVVDFFERL